MASNHGAGAQVDDTVDGFLDVIGRTEGQGMINFEPMANPDVAPFNRQYSWSEDLNRLRAQFPFMQIDPPLIATSKFRFDKANTDRALFPVPPNAQMYRVTFFSNSASVTLALSNIGVDTSSTMFDDSGILINPTDNWRYCRGLQSLALWVMGVGGTGQVWGTIEWFQQL